MKDRIEARLKWNRGSSSLALLCFIFSLHINTNAQESADNLDRFDIVAGLGFGHKSHFGNFGITGNLYFNKYLSLQASAGVAALNYGGGIVSLGPELSFLHRPKGFVSIAGMWSYTSGRFDILGDDDSADYVSYQTSNSKGLRGFIGYTIVRDAVFWRFETGYYHSLSNYSYFFGGPGTPTQKQLDDIETGLGSGFMASVSVNFNLPFKSSQTNRE